MEFEEIYDDVQVTTHHSSGDGDQSSQCYQGLMPKPSAPEYTNLSGISKRHNADQPYRTAYKSLMVVGGDDATKSEYAIANQSGAFLLDEHSDNDSNSLNRKPSAPPISAKRYVHQKKNVSINEPSTSQELKSQETEAPKGNFKAGCLYCLVLFTIVISLAALAAAIAGIVLWSNMQGPQYMSEVNCLIELLRNGSFCGEINNHLENTNQSACMAFQCAT